jgi:peptidoglycan-N-acetylglucosamine deacetylase
MSARIALTIDTEHPDRPCTPGNLPAILDALRAAGTRASFFIQGRWASANPAIARRIAEDGHTIGNHSNSHAPMDMLTDAGIAGSMSEAEEMIERASGVNPRPWFRCPYGHGQDDPRVLAAIERAGYRHVSWTIDTYDWQPDRTPADLVERVLDGHAREGDGAIAIMHSWPDVTAAALPALLERLRRAGADPVGVEQLG